MNLHRYYVTGRVAVTVPHNNRDTLYIKEHTIDGETEYSILCPVIGSQILKKTDYMFAYNKWDLIPSEKLLKLSRSLSDPLHPVFFRDLNECLSFLEGIIRANPEM